MWDNDLNRAELSGASRYLASSPSTMEPACYWSAQECIALSLDMLVPKGERHGNVRNDGCAEVRANDLDDGAGPKIRRSAREAESPR